MSAVVTQDLIAVSGWLLALERDIKAKRSALNHSDTPPPHRGKNYRKSALKFAHLSGRLESEYTPHIYKVAKSIATVSGLAWQDKQEVRALWHKLAIIVTNFSEHPNKKVAALIIDQAGNLQAFSANRIPEDVERKGRFYFKGKRKHFIVCAERMALARFFNIKMGKTRVSKDTHVIIAIDNFCKRLQKTITQTNALNQSVILTTSWPCESCAYPIGSSQPLAVIAPNVADEGFNSERLLSMINGRDILTKFGIRFIPTYN